MTKLNLKLLLEYIFQSNTNKSFDYSISTEPHKAKELVLEAMKQSYNKALDDVILLANQNNPTIHIIEINKLKIK